MRRATRQGRWLVTAAAFIAAAGLCTPAFAQTALDVPYVPQSEDLCGGAAAAMVMRYWGEPAIYAEAFAPLVDRSAHGIRTGTLSADLRRRGWTAVDGPGTIADLTRELARRRPVITLIEVRPNRFHYVVVVAATDKEVVLHDPARAPSRALSPVVFDAAWARADRWMLILLPPADRALRAAAEPPAPERPAPAGGCSGVDEGVRLANDGDYAAARKALEAAATACRGDAAPWRELAGVDALEKKWDAAADHARRAIAIAPRDAYAWRLLATAEYLRHHDLAALAAWNRVGEPIVDLVDVKGLRATRYHVVTEAMGVTPGHVLTPDAIRLAERRARDVPSVAAARVTFHPLESGRAQVDAGIIERERAPTSYPSWLAIGLGAAANREVSASIASPTGGGDSISATWRWWEHRPMIGVSYAAPGPRALGGGVWRVDASRETQTFATLPAEEIRTRAGFLVSRWMSSRLRIAGNAGIESWSDRGRTPVVGALGEFWPVADRLAVAAGATAWNDFAAGDAGVRWRSRAGTSGIVWLASAGYQIASGAAPLSLWPGADTGHARSVLLRAHPLLDNGIVTNGVFGRRLSYASAEIQRWQGIGKWPLRIAPAAFVDTARASRGLAGVSTAAQIDAGAGLRVSLLGLGVLRVDVGYGLRDGRTALSVGWQR